MRLVGQLEGLFAEALATWFGVNIVGVEPSRAMRQQALAKIAGRVSYLGGFGDRLEGVRWLRYFPSAREIAATRWPTVEATAEVFATAGFEVEALREVPEVVAPDLGSYHRRIAVRANSTLTLVDDDEFEGGIERLRQEAAAASSTEPVVDRRDLLVLR